MDSLHFVLAVGPIAIYLLLLGGINLSNRPLVTTGGRDWAALGIALSGLVVAGPMELFFPETFAARFGYWTWVLLLVGYALVILLVMLLSRPRLVIYNLTPDQLRPTLVEVASKLDADARWAGESVVLPNLGVQFLIDAFVAIKNVQLVAAGPQTNLDGWRRLEVELVHALKPVRTIPNPFGFMLTTFGSLLTAIVIYWLTQDAAGIAQSLETMLYLKKARVIAPKAQP